LLAIFHGMAQGLLVIKHRAEIAHIKPAFEGSETRSRSPDGVGE
jgi:hypothetical protein